MLETVVSFSGVPLRVRVASTQAEKERGLMNVRSMPSDCGMLFNLNGARPTKFWMKNTLIPLDVAYIDSGHKIVKIDRMEPLLGESECEPEAAYALEVNSGWFEENGIKRGSIMSFDKDEGNVRSIVDEIMTELWERPTCFADIVYRPFSEMFFQKIREMKQRSGSLNEGIVPFDNFTREALETDIGEFGLYEGDQVPLDIPIPDDFHYELYESKKLPKGAKLGQPRRGGGGGGGKFHVYVRDPKTKNVKKITFGAKGMSVGINNPKRRKSFVARHNCEKANDRTTASYWSCRLPRYWKQLGLKKTSFKFW